MNGENYSTFKEGFSEGEKLDELTILLEQFQVCFIKRTPNSLYSDLKGVDANIRMQTSM